MSGRLLGVDYGLERTGLAVTDPGQRIAFPLKTLHLRTLGCRKAMLEAIAHEAATQSVCGVVVGLPLLEDGTDSLTTRQVRNACARLKRRISLPFYFMPEYLSSEEAMQDLADCGIYGKAARDLIDQQAASRILQSFIERRIPRVAL